MDLKKSISFAGAVAALIAAAPLTTGCAASAAGDVRCEGINECKGTSECKSEGGANECKGLNECKGQGWIYVASEDECTAEGGTVL